MGFIDEAIISIAFGPTHKNEDYCMSQSVDGMDSLIICDHGHQVIYELMAGTELNMIREYWRYPLIRFI